MTEIVDVAIETNEGNFYQFLSVPMRSVLKSIERLGAGETLSMVNVDSAAIVIPCQTVRRVQTVSVLVETRDEDSWRLLWERPVEETPKRARKPKRKADHG